MNIKKAQKGFTMIELLSTIALLIVIAALVFPAATNYTDRGRDAKFDRAIAVINAQLGLRDSVEFGLNAPENWKQLHDRLMLIDDPSNTGIGAKIDEELAALMLSDTYKDTKDPITLDGFVVSWIE